MPKERPKIKVLIADQQPLFRQGVRTSLSQVGDIEICGEVTSGNDVISTISTLYPDVVLLDIQMSQTDGMDLATALPSYCCHLNPTTTNSSRQSSPAWPAT
jgi:DNA-binding NarL/FixJ family response regulator